MIFRKTIISNVINLTEFLLFQNNFLLIILIFELLDQIHLA